MTIKTDPISVYDFLKRINSSLASFSARIQGEVTSVSLGYSKAVYFTIKDKENDALLNCMIWRSTYDTNGLNLKEGDEIIVTGTPEIYAPRGSFSLKTYTIEYAGEGALKKAYEELKKKIEKEGLLDESRKRPLPKFPKKIGVITSKVGVVIQDFTSNLGRYGFNVTTVDSRVEGKDAIHDLLASLKTMAKQDIEVLVIMRGGGSWESLQPFNTESVVRAVAGFKCPVLTGIGHDTDVTLVQMVADFGASTPTAVAEALNDSWDRLVSVLDSSQTKIMRKFQENISYTSRIIIRNTNSTKRAFESLKKIIIRATIGFERSMATFRSHLRAKFKHLNDVSSQLTFKLNRRIESINTDLTDHSKQILSSYKKNIGSLSGSFTVLEKQIKIADPKRNLALGYSLSYSNKKLIRSISDVAEGDSITTHLFDGEFTSKIKKV